MNSYFRKCFFVFSCWLLIAGCEKPNNTPPPDDNPPAGTNIYIIHDEFEGVDVVVAGSKSLNFIVSYRNEVNGSSLTFSPVLGKLPVIMEDKHGNEWDIFGKALSGPLAGTELPVLNSGMGYWFSFGTLFPEAEIYGGPGVTEFYTPPSNGQNWLIPTETVFQGAGFDAILSLDEPNFVKYDFRDYLQTPFYVSDHNLLVGVSANGSKKAYPHALLNWHEIINDILNGVPLSVVYCPLTGTAKIWDRTVNGTVTTFGVSGLLYNSNIIPFDRATESLWTQLDGLCVNGDLIGEQAGQFRHVETTLSTWNLLYDRPLIATDETGVDREYSEYPYGDYVTNHDFISYPIAFDDQRLPRKERVHGIIVGEKARVYRFSSF